MFSASPPPCAYLASLDCSPVSSTTGSSPDTATPPSDNPTTWTGYYRPSQWSNTPLHVHTQPLQYVTQPAQWWDPSQTVSHHLHHQQAFSGHTCPPGYRYYNHLATSPWSHLAGQQTTWNQSTCTSSGVGLQGLPLQNHGTSQTSGQSYYTSYTWSQPDHDHTVSYPSYQTLTQTTTNTATKSSGKQPLWKYRLTRQQLQALEALYSHNKYISKAKSVIYGKKMNLSHEDIRVSVKGTYQCCLYLLDTPTLNYACD